MTTTMEVKNRPRSRGPDPSSSVENSSEPQCENKALGRGAKTNVKAAVGSECLDSDAKDPERLRTNEKG